MAGSTFLITDPAARLHAGMTVTVNHIGRQARGTVVTSRGADVEIELESNLLAQTLRTPTRVEVDYQTAAGPMRAPVTVLSTSGPRLRTQVAGLPNNLERRAAPRRAATLDAALTWLDPWQLVPRQAEGVTENVSSGGALIRLTHGDVRPPVGAPLLVGLVVLSGPLTIAGRVLTVTGDGIRIRFLDVDGTTRAHLEDLLPG